MSTETVAEEDVHIWRILLCIALGVFASAGVFAVTYSLLAALGTYAFATCLTFAILWVIGSAE